MLQNSFRDKPDRNEWLAAEKEGECWLKSRELGERVWDKEASGSNGVWLKRKGKRTKRKKKNWFAQGNNERGWAVDDEADSVHNPAVGFCVFAGVIVEQSNVITERKVLGRPADDVHQGVVPKLLLTDLFGPRPRDRE